MLDWLELGSRNSGIVNTFVFGLEKYMSQIPVYKYVCNGTWYLVQSHLDYKYVYFTFYMGWNLPAQAHIRGLIKGH